MDEKEKDKMLNKLRKYQTLNLHLEHLKTMKNELEKGKTLSQLKVLDANITNIVYIPDIERFRNKLKEMIQSEVDNEILRIEMEIKTL